MPRNFYKTYPRLSQNDIIKYIASNSSLKKEQVKECFETYSQMIKDIANSDIDCDDMRITLPFLGNFIFATKTWRKKGQSYVVPRMIGYSEMQILTAEDDIVVHYLRFKTSPKLNKEFREIMDERHKS